MHSMKLAIIFVIISSIVMVSDSTLIIAGLIAIKAAIVGAFIVGGIAGGIVGHNARAHGHGHGRWGRSVNNVDELFLIASRNDADDCAKKLICHLASRDVRTLAQDESAIVNLFGLGDLDVSKSTVEFDLAAIMGRRVGAEQCNQVYARCAFLPQTLMEVMRQPDFNNKV